jgi:selenocysteine lyase/cysteine desulfurase
MHVPEGSRARPLFTGWFAEYGDLSGVHGKEVLYADDGMRFAGATFDFSALYRLKAVLQMFASEGLTVDKIHSYIRDRQRLFLEELDRIQHPIINRSRLLMRDPEHHGGFLTFKLDSSEQVKHIATKLRGAGIITDHRADRLRFGFALYHVGPYDLSALRGI